MSFGKMNGFADIVKTKQVKDSEGFTHSEDEVLASIRVYREGRHGSQRWANLAAWGLVRGSSRTRIYLWPYLTDEGFYFGFSGNEVFMAYEMVKMYMALKGSGMPVKFCGSKKSIIKYLRQDDLIGIVPSYEIALYRQCEFPDQDIEDFMHFYPDEDGDIADAIEWQPIMPVILET